MNKSYTSSVSSVIVLQISAIRTGLLKTVPQAVLDLLTWQELEQRISGDPDISIEALRRSSKPSFILYNHQP